MVFSVFPWLNSPEIIMAKKTATKKAVKAAVEVEEVVPEPKAVRGKTLVVVESPAKAKTILKYLGPQYVVKASIGHVKDLPKKTLGVNVEKGFKPTYEVIATKKKVIAELKAAAKVAKQIFLAADPDREGEAICSHLAEELGDKKNGKPIRRIQIGRA